MLLGEEDDGSDPANETNAVLDGLLNSNVWDIVSDLSEHFATKAREDPQQCHKQSKPQKHVGHNGFFGEFDFCHTSNALLQLMCGICILSRQTHVEAIRRDAQ